MGDVNVTSEDFLPSGGRVDPNVARQVTRFTEPDHPAANTHPLLPVFSGRYSPFIAGFSADTHPLLPVFPPNAHRELQLFRPNPALIAGLFQALHRAQRHPSPSRRSNSSRSRAFAVRSIARR